MQDTCFSVSGADPLEDVLRLARPRAVIAGGFTAGQPWGLRFPALEKLKLFAVVRGSFQLSVEGFSPQSLGPGDVFLVWRRPFVLDGGAADAALEAVEVFRHSNFAQLGTDAQLLGVHVYLDAAASLLLGDLLRARIVLSAQSAGGSRSCWLIEQICDELKRGQAGARWAGEGLAQLLFLHLLRAHAAQAPAGWLRGLTDPRVAPALRSMHAHPERAWTVKQLAECGAVSRSSFAARFREVVGVAPLRYLLRWRMALASARLRDSDVSVGELSLQLGFGAESAFSHAFKREVGVSPRVFRARGPRDRVFH